MAQPKNIFITGKPGIGKTTLIKKLISNLPGKKKGFFTEEIRKRGKREGFKIITLEGKEGILAHRNFKSGPRVGKYRVNLSLFESLGVNSLWKGLKESEIIIVDEIGKMELFSKRFKEALLKILDSSKIFIGTIMEKDNSFTKSLKKRKDVKIFKLTFKNRNYLDKEILKFLKIYV